MSLLPLFLERKDIEYKADDATIRRCVSKALGGMHESI